MLDAKKTSWDTKLVSHFKEYDPFEKWFKAKFTGMKPETVWKKLGGTIPKKKEEEEEDK